MRTLVSLVAVIVAVAGVVWFLRRFPSAPRPVVWLSGALERRILDLCGAASATTDFLLSPRGGRLPRGRTALWLLTALLPMVAFFAAVAARLSLPSALDPGYLLLLGASFPVFVLGAAFLIVYEDYDVMDGIVAGDARRFGNSRTAARPSVVAFSVVLFAAYVIAIAWWLAGVDGVALVERQPQTGFIALDTILIGLRALPTDLLLSLLDRLTSDDTSVAFGASPAAQAYYFLVRTIGSGLAVGLVAIAVQQAWQLRRIVTEIGESDRRRAYLIERASMAPPFIRRGILRAATTPGSPEAQQRLIVAAQAIGIFALPETFCRRLESFGPELQVFGLDRCLEMFRYRAKEFDLARCAEILRASAPVLASGTLEVEPLKTLVRLMTSIVIVKTQSVEVPEPVKAVIMAALKGELAKLRAKDDAALRGFLRDLQSALGGAPIIVRPIALPDRAANDWLKRLPLPPVADPAVRPDSPSPTMH